MTDIYGSWIDLKNEVFACNACENSSNKRLFDRGERQSRIMIVGDRPSEADFAEKTVFSGEESAYVTETLKLVDIPYQKVYMTYLIKCCTSKNTDEVAESCISHLRRQFALVKPQLVICLGEFVARKLIAPDFSLEKSHGEVITKGKTMFMATFSPDTFLKNIYNRDCFLGDFLKIKNCCPL